MNNTLQPPSTQLLFILFFYLLFGYVISIIIYPYIKLGSFYLFGFHVILRVKTEIFCPELQSCHAR